MDCFDETFIIKKKPYTIEDHNSYEASSVREEEFPVCSQTITNPPTVSLDISNENDSKIQNIPSCSVKVLTSRPELTNDFSVKFKNSSDTTVTSVLKRKAPEEVIIEPWVDTVLTNLNKCNQGIQFEGEILSHLKDCGFLREGKKEGSSVCSFFAFEDAVFKLASTPNCSSGVFVYTIFQYSYNQADHYYIRYLESGFYTGFMDAEHKHDILKLLNTTEDYVFMSMIATQSDIEKSKTNFKLKKQAAKPAKQLPKAKATRERSDLTYDRNQKKAVLEIKKSLKESEVTGACLKNYVFYCMREGVKVKTDTEKHGDKIILESNLRGIEYFEQLRGKLMQFPIEKNSGAINSTTESFIHSKLPDNISILSQSIALNSLSSATEAQINCSGGKLGTRFSTRFADNEKACSLRNKVIYFFNHELTDSLQFCIKSHLQPSPCITRSSTLNKRICNIPEAVDSKTSNKKRKTESCYKKVTITTDMIAEQANDVDLDEMIILKDTSMPIYESYKNQLITSEKGKMIIQVYNENKSLTAVLNDIDAEEGNFKDYEFAITSWLSTEVGDYLKCTCKIYKTLLDLNDCSDSNVTLDSQGATCMHCRFLREDVLPNLSTSSHTTLSEKQLFIRRSLAFKNVKIAELTSESSRKTIKFSVLENGTVSIVSLSYNNRKGRYIASCHNGSCKSKKGSKKYVQHLVSANLCPHLATLKDNPQFWKKLTNTNNSETSDISDDEECEFAQNETVHTQDDCVTDLSCNFNPDTGLWSFPCKSKHRPRKCGDGGLVKNIRLRDTWMYERLQKLEDGCLEGPNLIPEITEETCACGAGWTNSENIDGIIIDINRRLTIYTFNAPVVCKIFKRNCISTSNPCTQLWDEGEKLHLHVMSNETAAGDEIGWEFVNSVLNSGTTFSAYCKMITSNYQMRNPYSRRFMDPKTFLKWWFSWAASMKKDFRKPCPGCKYSPKQLACDGTKVGIGLRNVNFEEISKPDNCDMLPTLHRRIDRCFISNDSPNVNSNEIRAHLYYLGKKVLNELSESELQTEEEEKRKNESTFNFLPDVKASFERFLSDMPVKEKDAYAVVLKMLSTTAPVSSLIPTLYAEEFVRLVNYIAGSEEQPNGAGFSSNAMADMRSYAPELRHLIECSRESNEIETLMPDIADLLRYLADLSLN